MTNSMATPPALTGTRQEVDDPLVGRLSWYQAGPTKPGASATPLVLLHSVNAAASAYEMKPLYEHYGRERPVYALDLPGFGFSERSDRPYSPRLMTDAIHALLAEIRREHGAVQVDALAVSLSAEFLARAAVESPEAFSSLALVSPTGIGRTMPGVGPEGSTSGRSTPLRVLKLLGLRRWLFDQLTRRRSIRYFLRKAWGSRRIDIGLLEYAYSTSRPKGAEFAPLRFVAGLLFSGDSGSLYRTLVQPVLAVRGIRGGFVDHHIHDMADRPNWTVKVLPTGSLPYFESPAEFVRYYDAWRARLGVATAVNVIAPRQTYRTSPIAAERLLAGSTTAV
jgi:pimeloyl-ACP methyl ester carboxylesterase